MGRIDDREDYGEARLRSAGVDTEMHRVVFTWQGENLIRIISAEKASCEQREMKLKSTIEQHSPIQIGDIGERGEDKTSPDAPNAESLGADFWETAPVFMPGGKTSVHLRLDSDVVRWFKSKGKGHLTRMNAVLKAYVEAQKN
jgi:uncharacterized protein (DUF4415 family)